MLATRNTFLRLGCLSIVLALASPTHAEVKKYVRMCEGKLCPFYHLLFTPPTGWVEEKQASQENQVQMFAPRGKTFRDAGALIYIKVSHNGDKRSLEEFARTSQERWREAVKQTTIEQLASEKRANGKPDFQVYRYRTPSRPQQEHEIVAFGEDGDKDGNTFFLMVVLTGAKRPAIDKAEAAYRSGLRAH